MRDNFLRDAKISQFGLFVWCANLAAFFCTLSNALICPSLYGSQHAVPYSRIGRTSDMYAKLLVLLLPFFMFDAKLLLQPETLLSSKH